MQRVCIFGQGFVGLPLALSFALKGYVVSGVDVDEALVKNINSGITSLREQYMGRSIQNILKEELSKGRYIALTEGERAVKDCSNIIVTVGIPVNKYCFSMQPLEQCCRKIGKNIKKGDLVLVRSTLVPGTTEDFILPILEEESGMQEGSDFYLAYASERIAEGRAFDEFENMPALVGANSDASMKRAAELMKTVCRGQLVRSTCIKAVETAKLFENIQRDVNIALSQEFARFTEAFDIDIFEVIRLANTHSRVNLLLPGAGVGGHCIPNAYYYLETKAAKLGVNMELTALARSKNDLIPEFVFSKARDLLLMSGRNVKNCRAAVLGLAMKDFSSDDRMSPSIELCRQLIKNGAEVKAFDPEVKNFYEFKTDTLEDTLKNADIVFILDRQQGIDFTKVQKWLQNEGKSAVCMDLKGVIDEKQALQHGAGYWRI